MNKKIVIIDGHPDQNRSRYCHAIANAYASGAKEGGHNVEIIEISEADFPILRKKEDFESEPEHRLIEHAQLLIKAADHLVIIYPLWLGAMPALLKGFIEQVFRPGFAFAYSESSKFPTKLLTNKSCRIIVTMGMPAILYRMFYLSHSLKSLERNILAFVGIKPVRETLLGMVEAVSDAKRKKWLGLINQYGREAR